MISVQNLSKRYGDQVIFDSISFSIVPNERIGLVGRNGHGKTTFFRLITGQEPYEEGTIVFPKDYRIGHLSQHIDFSMATVLEEGCCGLPHDREAEEWKVKKILSGLGFSDEDFEKHPKKLSGGYQIRLNLAKVLVSEPNLLLLDEPTNFLDIVSIRWLIRFLNTWRSEAMIISHDRGFMDSVCTHIIGIHRSKIKKIAGSTQHYYAQIAREEDTHEKQRLNVEKKQKHMEDFIHRFRAKAHKANLAQSRIKTLSKQEKIEKLDKVKTLSFSFNRKTFPGKILLEAHNITFSYGEDSPHLIKNFNLAAEKNAKICIIGKNGKGKTTLLKLLSGALSPLCGEIKVHPQTEIAYFEQSNTVNLNNERTVEEEILLSEPDGDRKRSRDICGAMMFSGDNALKKIGVLSGGEKCRVLLGKILVKPANLLLLDEPTHHLDMESCEAMMEALVSFDGTVIMVTHNEEIIHRLAKKLIVFHHDQIFAFQGEYPQFLDRIGWEDPESIEAEKQLFKESTPSEKPGNKKDRRRERAEFITRRSKALTTYKKSIDALEKIIEKAEDELHHDTEALIKASEEQDGPAIARLSKSLQQLRTRINTLYSELEETTGKYEQEKLAFDQDSF